jgi:hypothetical protein
MAKVTNGPLIQVTHWAVGRVPDTAQVAIKLNDFSFLMSVEDAGHIAAAINSEAESLDKSKPPPAHLTVVRRK